MRILYNRSVKEQCGTLMKCIQYIVVRENSEHSYEVRFKDITETVLAKISFPKYDTVIFKFIENIRKIQRCCLEDSLRKTFNFLFE